MRSFSLLAGLLLLGASCAGGQTVATAQLTIEPPQAEKARSYVQIVKDRAIRQLALGRILCANPTPQATLSTHLVLLHPVERQHGAALQGLLDGPGHPLLSRAAVVAERQKRLNDAVVDLIDACNGNKKDRIAGARDKVKGELARLQAAAEATLGALSGSPVKRAVAELDREEAARLQSVPGNLAAVEATLGRVPAKARAGSLDHLRRRRLELLRDAYKGWLSRARAVARKRDLRDQRLALLLEVDHHLDSQKSSDDRP